MAAVDFPDTPTTGDVFQVGTRRWEYDGTKWKAKPFGNEPFTANTVTATTVNATTLNVDSTEIDLTGTITGDTLVYDGSKYSRFPYGSKIDANIIATKGDIIAGDPLGVAVTQSVGADATVLTADSLSTTGLSWEPVNDSSKIAKTVLAAKGSLVTATSTGVPVNLGVGANGEILVADNTQASGIKWGAIGPSAIGANSIDTANLVDNAVTNVKITNYTIGSEKLGPVQLNVIAAGGVYSLIGADRNKVIIMASNLTQGVNVPAESNVFFEDGVQIAVIQTGTGVTSFTADAGVTIRSDGGKLKINAQYTAVSLLKIGADEWFLAGALKA